MKRLPLKRDILLPRIQGIEDALLYLQERAKTPFREFAKGPYFGDANFHLHNIIEGIFNIGIHILSRIPGAARKTTRYVDTAVNLGKFGIVSDDFADKVLVPMARYRNRLVHGYAKILPEETYKILQKNFGDVERFLHYIKKLVKNHKKFGFTLE